MLATDVDENATVSIGPVAPLLNRLVRDSSTRRRRPRVVKAILRSVNLGLIDVEAERERIGKELAKVDADIEFVNKRLGNENFVQRAPQHLVEKEREKLAGYQAAKKVLVDGLAALEQA